MAAATPCAPFILVCQMCKREIDLKEDFNTFPKCIHTICCRSPRCLEQSTDRDPDTLICPKCVEGYKMQMSPGTRSSPSPGQDCCHPAREAEARGSNPSRGKSETEKCGRDDCFTCPHMCDVGMGAYAGFSPTIGSFGYYPHHQQSVMSPSSNRHHPYHTPHRLHHNSTGSSGSSVAELGEITKVINEDLSTGNINDQQGHHYTNMDNMDVDIQHQMKMDSSGGMTPQQHFINNKKDPSQINYRDPTSVTSSGMTIPYSSVQTPHSALTRRSYSARTDYDQQASPPTAINAITMASNVLSGEDEGLEACTATSVGINGHYRRQIKDEELHCLPSEHEMSIQMYYRSTNVGLHHVQADGGCMVYFREPYDVEVRRNMQLIRMPDIKDIPENEVKGKPREYIGKILDCCDKGLSLTCRDGCIYVKRHCRSVLFWSTSEYSTRSEKLERDVETKIFDLDHFRQRLRQYYEGTIPSPVVPEINFSIAQKLCDGFELKACFISFVVRPLRAVEELRTLNNEARSLPYSSHSGLLKFSGSDMHNDVFATTSVSPLLAQAAAGLGPWGDMSPYAASCPMVPQAAVAQVN